MTFTAAVKELIQGKEGTYIRRAVWGKDGGINLAEKSLLQDIYEGAALGYSHIQAKDVLAKDWEVVKIKN